MAKLPTKLIWSPTLAFHDPDPPIRIESSLAADATFTSTGVGELLGFSGSAVPEDASWFASGAGLFDAFSSSATPVDAAWFSSGEGAFNAFSGSAIPADASWFASGSGVFNAMADEEESSAFVSAGSSEALFYGERAFVARCEDAYEYDPVGGPSWDGTLRREPEIMLRSASNDSPSNSTFRDEEDPQLGSNVQLDMNDGFGVMAGGVVQSKVMNYDGRTDVTVFDTTVADYLWLLNKRRPFMCMTAAADVIAQALRTTYAPADFSGAGIVAGLPTISVEFDGSLDFSGCMSVIAGKIAGYFKVDKDKVLHLFQDDPTPGPTVIDDDNMLLIRDQPLSVKTDISQLRNRVFIRGAAAHLLNDTSPGVTELEVDGIDVFSPTGGEAIIGCDRFTYTGVNKSYIYPPPPPQLPAMVQAFDPTASPGYTPDQPSARVDDTQEGPIQTRVRYSVSFVINGVETDRGNPTVIDVQQVSPGVAMAGGFPGTRQVLPGLGFAVGDASLFGWVTHTGKVIVHSAFSIGYADVNNMVPSKHVYGPYPTQGVLTTHPDPRVKSFRLWRMMTWLDAFWHEVLTVNEGTIPVDVYDPASLGGRPDFKDDLFFFSGQMQNDSGSRVWITNVPQGPAGITSERRVYREEIFNGYTAWTQPRVVLTIPGNGAFGAAEIEDTTPTSTHAWEAGVIFVGPDGPVVVPQEPQPPSVAAPPEVKPKIRLTLTGVSGLDEAHFEGDEVAIFTQVDDLPSQLAMAVAEGGDGLHEFMVIDTNLRTNEELLVRGQAELTLFKDPIVEARYSTFDPTLPGATVEFNLTNPPFVASLKVTEVTIDKVHHTHGHVARYNVTASSVKFTLQDLLRRTILRPY